MIVQVETEIAAIVKDVVELKTILTYPVQDVPGQLPALSIIYQGVGQEAATTKNTDNVWRFELTLLLQIENLKKSWQKMKDTVPKILESFRLNPGLNGTCYYSMITTGEAFINTEANKPHFGHTFTIEVHREEI